MFATTALVMTAGVASAEVAFSGKAGAGIGKTASTDAVVWSGFDLDFKASTTTDSGMTITFSEDIGGGSLADYDDDYAIEGQGSTPGTPKITIGVSGITIALKNAGIDDRYDDGQSGDIGIDASIGDIKAGITVATSQAYSATASTTLSGISLSATATGDNGDGDAAAKFSVGYTIDALGLTLISDNKGGDPTVNTVKLAYSADAISGSVSFNDDDEWDLSVGYSAGALGFNIATDEGDAWEANMTYALGGGATFKAAANASEYVAAGIQFTF